MFFKRIGQSGWGSRWRVCYYEGLPLLFFMKIFKMLSPVIESAFDIFIEVPLVHTESGVGIICLVNIFHSFIWVSDHEIVCTGKVQSKIWIQMNVVLILVSQRHCVYQRNLYCVYSQEYGFHELGWTFCSIYIRTWIILFHWNTKLYVIGLVKIV